MQEKQRLDAFLVSKKLIENRSAAKAAVMAGLVTVEGRQVTKPGFMIKDQKVEVKPFSRYVSRAALKLEKALEVFNVSVQGKRVLDIGAGSGGFSQVLLEQGADRIAAVDVGYGQYSWKLRKDPRITLLERTNIRYLKEKQIGWKADLAVIDLSFISVLKVIENIKKILQKNADIIILIKPQFEAGKGVVPKGGVIKDKNTHFKVVSDFNRLLEEKGVCAQNLSFSPILGAKGNIEFIGHYSFERLAVSINVKSVVEQAHGELYGD